MIVAQVPTVGDHFVAAVTATKPLHASCLCVAAFSHYQQTTKALSQQVLAIQTRTIRYAATGLTNTLAQNFARNGAFGSAITPAMPKQSARVIMSAAIENEPAAKPLVSYIFGLRVRGSILRLHEKFTFLVPRPGTSHVVAWVHLFVGLHYTTWAAMQGLKL
jgi:hypothetical protein